jgi:acyl carrier protein
MTAPPWPRNFETIVRSCLPWLADDAVLEPDLALIDFGLDSVATVSLLIDLEEEFGVEIPDQMLMASNFTSPAGIWGLLTALEAAGDDHALGGGR